MNTSHKRLFESIQAKCQQEHWFGPELLSPTYRMHVFANDPNRLALSFPLLTRKSYRKQRLVSVFFYPSCCALFTPRLPTVVLDQEWD
jgi:hypothetical protein